MITKQELINKLTDLWNEQAKNYNDEKDYFTGISNALELVRQLPDSERECELIEMKSCENGKPYLACSECKSSIWHDNENYCYHCGSHIKGRPNPRERGGE